MHHTSKNNRIWIPRDRAIPARFSGIDSEFNGIPLKFSGKVWDSVKISGIKDWNSVPKASVEEYIVWPQGHTRKPEPRISTNSNSMCEGRGRVLRPGELGRVARI